MLDLDTKSPLTLFRVSLSLSRTVQGVYLPTLLIFCPLLDHHQQQQPIIKTYSYFSHPKRFFHLPMQLTCLNQSTDTACYRQQILHCQANGQLSVFILLHLTQFITLSLIRGLHLLSKYHTFYSFLPSSLVSNPQSLVCAFSSS